LGKERKLLALNCLGALRVVRRRLGYGLGRGDEAIAPNTAAFGLRNNAVAALAEIRNTRVDRMADGPEFRVRAAETAGRNQHREDSVCVGFGALRSAISDMGVPRNRRSRVARDSIERHWERIASWVSHNDETLLTVRFRGGKITRVDLRNREQRWELQPTE
jgi:hypothetical protein